MPSRNKGNGHDKLSTEARRGEIAGYLKKKWTYAEIAAELGVSVNTVNNDVRWLRSQWAKAYDDAREELAAESIMDISHHERRIMDFIESLVPADQLAAIDRLVKLMDRKHRLLGLEQGPAKNMYGAVLPEESGDNGSPIKIQIEVIPAGNRVEITNQDDDGEEPDDGDDLG